MNASAGSATVAVIGMGDVGARVVDALSALRVGRIVAIGRHEERTREVAGLASVVATLTGGAEHVVGERGDVGDVDAMASQLRRLAPDVIVMAASRHSWWRTPEELSALPYGAWLPLQVGLTRDLMLARAAAGVAAPVVALAYPDAVGPVLRGLGLAPELGAGNVAEIAAKVELLAAAGAGVERAEVDVRLIAHHAVERLAFSAFSALGGVDGDGAAAAPPPWRAAVSVAGEPLPAEVVREMLTAPHPLPAGTRIHLMTAAAVAAAVEALLSDAPRRLHVPAPAGRPGGYPVLVSRSGIALDLPSDVGESDAEAINGTAARWDGIERIHPDGTVQFTGAVADLSERVLGWRLDRVRADEMDAVAAEMERHLRRAADVHRHA